MCPAVDASEMICQIDGSYMLDIPAVLGICFINEMMVRNSDIHILNNMMFVLYFHVIHRFGAIILR